MASICSTVAYRTTQVRAGPFPTDSLKAPRIIWLASSIVASLNTEVAPIVRTTCGATVCGSWSLGTKQSTMTWAPGNKRFADCTKHSNCSGSVSKLKSVLYAKSTTPNCSSGMSATMWPNSASTKCPSGFALSAASMAGDESIPTTRSPLCARGIASRPVPTPSSSTEVCSASWRTNSTTSSTGSRSWYQSS